MVLRKQSGFEVFETENNVSIFLAYLFTGLINYLNRQLH